MIYAAYYRKDATFREDGHLSKMDLLSGKTHALIGFFEARNFDHLYEMLQGENIATLGFDTSRIKALGLDHTSMSVGDAAIQVETEEALQVANIGWELIPEMA